MSHELRKPLNGIIGFAEFLADGKPGEVTQSKILSNSGKHLLQLISDILDLTKVLTGEMELHPERFLLCAATFATLSKFVIANDKTVEVKKAFRHRPHLVDEQPGFIRLEVFSPLDRLEEIWLITYWTDGESFKLWHHSHLYQQAHKGIPKDLKLVPCETEVRHFEHICS